MSIQEVLYTASASFSDYTRDQKDSVFGGELDMWGAELTPGMLNDPSFKIVFDAEFPTGTLLVDDVSAEVFFTLPYTYNPDGVPHLSSSLNGIAIGAVDGRTTIVVVGEKGGIRTTDNKGVTWTEQNSGVTEDLWAVSATETGFVAVGSGGVILESSDAATWQEVPSEATESLFAINGKRVKVAAGNATGLQRKTTEWKTVRPR